ncbi:protein kinase domain-containing protein [Dactylosporangium sp. CA-052675]|uniref:serine/threonine-protein kinase n=1 Tax=Dactylosporangium sp. CA-052675 TaxID=3239927 RepID=UPI003D9131E3
MKTLADRYRLDYAIGAGGMGIVWRARDLRRQLMVAIKEVRLPELMTTAERDRVNREARAAGRVEHPAIVRVHEVVVTDDGPWIVMDLVEGRSLGERVSTEGPLPAAEGAQLGLVLLDALAAAHAAGITHGDVKPANVLLPPDGTAQLTDFAVAAMLDGHLPLSDPAFVAPERRQTGEGGPEADLYSLGATLALASPDAAPEIVAALMHEDPKARPSLEAVRAALSAVAGHPAVVPPESPTNPKQTDTPTPATEQPGTTDTVGAGPAATTIAMALSGTPTEPDPADKTTTPGESGTADEAPETTANPHGPAAAASWPDGADVTQEQPLVTAALPEATAATGEATAALPEATAATGEATAALPEATAATGEATAALLEATAAAGEATTATGEATTAAAETEAGAEAATAPAEAAQAAKHERPAPPGIRSELKVAALIGAGVLAFLIAVAFFLDGGGPTSANQAAAQTSSATDAALVNTEPSPSPSDDLPSPSVEPSPSSQPQTTTRAPKTTRPTTNSPKPPTVTSAKIGLNPVTYNGPCSGNGLDVQVTVTITTNQPGTKVTFATTGKAAKTVTAVDGTYTETYRVRVDSSRKYSFPMTLSVTSPGTTTDSLTFTNACTKP